MKKKEKTDMDILKLDFRKMVLGSIILNILFLIFGIIIYLKPYTTLDLVGIIIGIYFILFGLYGIFEFFMRKASPIFKFKIFTGILTIIIGILAITNPFKIIKILTFTLGLYLIVISIAKAITALKLRTYKYEGWLITLVTAVILLIFGVFVAINPMASLSLVKATSIFIILSSIVEMCNLVMLYKNGLELSKCFLKEE